MENSFDIIILHVLICLLIFHSAYVGRIGELKIREKLQSTKLIIRT